MIQEGTAKNWKNWRFKASKNCRNWTEENQQLKMNFGQRKIKFWLKRAGNRAF